MELEFTKLEFHVAFLQLGNPRQRKFFYETRVFKTRFTQQTRVLKKWYIATYLANSGMLLIISAKSGKWPIWPRNRGAKIFVDGM